jgi:hypothetical protein
MYIIVIYTTFVTGAPAEALFATLTGTLPAVAMSDAPMDAVNSVEDTNVVGRALPFHCTTDVEEKPVPMSVRTKAPPPACISPFKRRRRRRCCLPSLRTL